MLEHQICVRRPRLRASPCRRPSRSRPGPASAPRPAGSPDRRRPVRRTPPARRRRSAYDVADRAGPAGEQLADDPGIDRSVTADQVGDVGPRDAEIGRVELALPTVPSAKTQTVDVVVVVSSSRPSAPWNTRPRSPRPANTPAVRAAIRASATPTAWATGWAGLANGPRKLNVVRMPSSLRAPGMAQRRVVVRREQESDPDLVDDRGLAPGARSSTTPSASSTSAAPQAEDAARLPCLTTRAPAAAATTAAIVEMLTVLDRSPPEPTMSTAGPGDLDRRGEVEHRVGQSGDLLDRLALAPQRDHEAACWAASPRRSGSAPSPRPWPSRARSSPADQGAEQSGQVGSVGRAPVRHVRRPIGDTSVPDRSSAATASGSRIGSTGCGDHAVGPRPGRQPGVVGAAGEHQDRRAAEDLVLQLATQAHAAGHGLAVQDRQVDAAASIAVDHRGLGRHLQHADVRQVGGDLAAEGDPDVLTHGPVGGVEQDHAPRRHPRSGRCAGLIGLASMSSPSVSWRS